MTNTELTQTDPLDEIADAPELKGFRGWLALMGVGMALAPFRSLADAVASTHETIDNLHLITAYPGATSLLRFEAATPWLLAALAATSSVLFFRKSRYFIRSFVVLWLAPMALMLLDSMAASFVFDMPVGKFIGYTFEDKQFVMSFGSGLLWFMYLVNSHRVANTFGK